MSINPSLAKAGHIGRQVLELALAPAKPAVTTDEIDALAIDDRIVVLSL